MPRQRAILELCLDIRSVKKVFRLALVRHQFGNCHPHTCAVLIKADSKCPLPEQDMKDLRAALIGYSKNANLWNVPDFHVFIFAFIYRPDLHNNSGRIFPRDQENESAKSM
jgi:hypothetical protein